MIRQSQLEAFAELSQMPEAGIDRKTYRTNKFGSWEYSQMLDAKTVQAGKGDGIEFRYDLMKVTPNTLKAHRLTWLAGKDGNATEMVERILRAYFTEGQDIGDVETLANLAADIGIDAQKAKAFLLSDEGIEEIKQLKQQAICADARSPLASPLGRRLEESFANAAALRYRSGYPQRTYYPHPQGNTSRRSIG